MSPSNKGNGNDRRQSRRFDTSVEVGIRLMADGPQFSGNAIEIGPNGLRVITETPLVEASLVHVTLPGASNNTHCEGRVVWTQRAEDPEKYESGIDIQRWGGGMPGQEAIEEIPKKPSTRERRRRNQNRAA